MQTDPRTPPDPRSLPAWVDRYATVGLGGVALGTVLCLFALFTNPVPDPSFPWFTLPASWRLPVTQPHIEHWPVSYTLGIWLWVFCFPSLFLVGYRRYRDAIGPTWWLAGLPAASMIAWTTYCRFFWPKLYPASWNAPSYTFVCWLYCSSYEPVWSNAAYAVAGVGVIATAVAARRLRPDTLALGAFGVLALPLGLPALFEASRRARGR